MIPAEYYQTIYLLLVLFMTMRMMQMYTPATVSNLERIHVSRVRLARILAVVLIFFIGLRPVSIVFIDTIPAVDSYESIQSGDIGAAMRFYSGNLIYDPLFIFCANIGIPVGCFLTFIAAIYFGCIFVACKKIFSHDTLLAFLAYLGAFSTFAFSVNGFKNGAAASLFLVAVAYKGKWKVVIPFLILALGFHHAMAIPVSAYIAACFFKERKWYLYFWIACLLMAAFHVTFFMNILSGFTDERGADYLQGTDDPVANVSGFRPDFILYSAIPILVGNYLVKKFRIQSTFYDFIWNTYTLANSVFLLCTYASYINRIAYLSWLLYPFVLLYPFLNVYWSERQDVYLKYTVWGHLGFTLFMFFIYYA